MFADSTAQSDDLVEEKSELTNPFAPTKTNALSFFSWYPKYLLFFLFQVVAKTLDPLRDFAYPFLPVLTGAAVLIVQPVLLSLKDAVEKDHLTSDTYRKLLLATGGYSAGLAFAAASAWLWIPSSWLLAALPALWGAGFCVALWARHLPSGTSPPREFAAGLADNLQALVPQRSWASTLYAILAAGSLFSGASALLQTGRALTAPFLSDVLEDSLVMLLPGRVCGLANLLLGAALVTLKGAAERGRLRASTFQRLNGGVAALAFVRLLAVAQYLPPGAPPTAVIHWWNVLLGTVALHYYMA